MLSVDDVIKDFDAVIAGREQIVKILEPSSTWPAGLTVTQNLIELAWHQVEFQLRHSFAYTVMTSDESECLGCCYIFPSDNPRFDVMAQYWGRTAANDAAIGVVFRKSLAHDWPFRTVGYPGRDISWADWSR